MQNFVSQKHHVYLVDDEGTALQTIKHSCSEYLNMPVLKNTGGTPKIRHLWSNHICMYLFSSKYRTNETTLSSCPESHPTAGFQSKSTLKVC